MQLGFGGVFALSMSAAVVLVAGCASQVMEGMVGKDVSQVVAQYGPPVNAYDMPDGRRAFQWRMENAVVMPTTTNYMGHGYGNTVTGNAITTGGYMGTMVCFYTLYAKAQGKQWTIVGFEKPRLDCE